MVGNKKERKTHHCCLLHATHEHGKAAVGSYSESQLRESKLHNGRKNSLIEKDFSEKKLGSGGGLKTTDKLTKPAWSGIATLLKSVRGVAGLRQQVRWPIGSNNLIEKVNGEIFYVRGKKT